MKKEFSEADFPEKAAVVFASWFGAGFLPFAPGTFGSLAGLPMVILSSYARPAVAAVFLFCFVALATWASGIVCKVVDQRDPPHVVIDEVAGFLLALFLVPVSWLSVSVGFFLFRLLDIVKPYPIRKLEELRGGKGIVFDDLMAGIYANLCLRTILWVTG